MGKRSNKTLEEGKKMVEGKHTTVLRKSYKSVVLQYLL